MLTMSDDSGIENFIVLLNKPTYKSKTLSLKKKKKTLSHLSHLFNLLVHLKIYVKIILMNIEIFTHRMTDVHIFMNK